MIGVDPNTGKTITGLPQLRSRFLNMVTTYKSSRERSREFGSNCRKNMDNNMSDSVLMQIQARAIEGVEDPNNGLLDFTITQCQASRTSSGARLSVVGVWQRDKVAFEVPVNV
ncbi:MAG: phage baseplate protein [Vibrio sp.]